MVRSELTSSISKMLSESASLDAQGNLYGAQTAYYKALKHFTETQDSKKMMLILKFLVILSHTVIIWIVRLSNRASAAVKPAEAQYYQSSANAA